MSEQTDDAVATAFREEWPRLTAAALRITGDLQAAEDSAQDALLAALDHWPLEGMPDRPGAWLMTVCRNRARNLVRDTSRARERLASLTLQSDGLSAAAAAADAAASQIADDELRLIALCCHPGLSADTQIALTLRMVAGLTTEEIARGFSLPVATIAQRIVRAKRTLRECTVALATEDPDIGSRLDAVLDVIYLIFNEGYLPAGGSSLTRPDLAFEARRLACLLTSLLPGEPDTWALRALLSFHLSRWSTRTGPEGTLLTLDVQNRTQWDRELINDGIAAVERARSGPRGPLLLQAELAACHATAPSSLATDWNAIVALYDELLVLQDTAVVALNRAVAVAMATGPDAALVSLDELVGHPALAGSHRVWAIRADVNRRAGHTVAAIADYDRALDLVKNDAERHYLVGARQQAEQEVAESSVHKGD